MPQTRHRRAGTFELTKRFGSFTALDHVSLKVRARHRARAAGRKRRGQEHAGEVRGRLPAARRGASADRRARAGHRQPIRGARQLGIGMVYQHFTLVPGMTVAENLLLARGRICRR
jgi:simple sugar transport system ATP-binding protein